MSKFKMITFLYCVIVLWLTTDVVQGRYTYKADVQRWVTQHKVIATWGEAKRRCEEEGAILASPIDENLLQHIKSYVTANTKHSSSYFIGTKAGYNPDPEFISIEGVLLDDMPEAVTDMIEELDPHEGDCLYMDRKGIKVVPCYKRLPYICYTNVTTNNITKEITPPTVEVTTSTAKPVLNCSDLGYEYASPGICYKLHRGHSTWREGNKTCTDEGAYLVIFNDEKEAKTVVEMFSKESKLPSSWVGIRDDTGNGHWQSVHGEPMDQIYNVWHKYSTNLYVGDACGLVNDKGQLFDYFCNYYYAFICEKHI